MPPFVKVVLYRASTDTRVRMRVEANRIEQLMREFPGWEIISVPK